MTFQTLSMDDANNLTKTCRAIGSKPRRPKRKRPPETARNEGNEPKRKKAAEMNASNAPREAKRGQYKWTKLRRVNSNLLNCLAIDKQETGLREQYSQQRE